MERVERFWQSLWRRRGGGKEEPKLLEMEEKRRRGEEEEVERRGVGGANKQEENRSALQGSETFPRGRDRANERSPVIGRHKGVGGSLGVSSASLKGRRQDPYDRNQWSSTQHFHVPYGTQGRQQSSIPRGRSTSRGGLSMLSAENVMSRSLPRSHSPVSQHSSGVGTMRRPIEPNPVIQHHFHVPTNRKKRVVYGRGGQKTAMTALVDDLRSRPSCRTRSPSMNNEEPIQLAHFPGGTPGQSAIERDDFPGPSFSLSLLEDRKRRLSGSEGEFEEVVSDTEEEEKEETKLKRTEQELQKISSGIGKVFLDTIRQREKIKSSKLANIDPRSAARTPSANKEPRYGLRYTSPAWASPSRDTLHARPWDSQEDLERPVVLSSNGCASGCTSDLCPPANTSLLYGLTMPREDRTLRPGYTHSANRFLTLPHIKSVSGRIIDEELEVRADSRAASSSTPALLTPPVNTHSGILYTTNNSFSWLSLAKYQNDDTLRRNTGTKFFHRPELRHRTTILDQ